jgi:sulfane dehydrogenase subunit SoxC
LLPEGKWILAEGADSAGMSRSIPLGKAMDDAIIAIYQNGEMLRPEQGYPMRLLLPGFEGNMSVKWLRRIKVTSNPTYTKDETSKYSDLMPDGMARQFTYTMGVKSTITRPAGGLVMNGPGLYEISGLAWSGSGKIIKVEVSADGGTTWAAAALDGEPLTMALTRFRIPWTCDGLPTLLQSRATDEAGNTQLRRDVWSAQYAEGQLYHCNAIQTWSIARNGEVTNVFI